MTVEEHLEFAEVLNSVKGHVVLSGYASPEYDEWYRGWKRVDFDQLCSFDWIGKRSEINAPSLVD